MSRRLKYRLKAQNIETWVTWSPIQTAAKAWKGLYKPWDDILQDEHRSRDVGKGSGTASAMLSSLEQTAFRFDKNNVLFCAPTNHPHKYHFALEAIGWEEELKIRGKTLHNVNLLMLFGPRFKMPMGIVYLSDEEWPLDPYISKKHDTDEIAWKRLVKRYGGVPPEVDPDIVEFCENKLLEYLKEHYPVDMFDMNRLEIERVYSIELQLPTVFFMDQTIAGVQAEIRRLGRQKHAEELLERETALKEHRQEQEDLIQDVAPRVVKHFLDFTTDRMESPPAGAIRDYLSRFTTLDEAFYQKCLNHIRHLWLKMKAGADWMNEARQIVLTPAPVSTKTFSIDSAFWLKQVRDRYPKLVMEKYFDAYEKYIHGEEGWTSESKIVTKIPGLKSKSTVHEMFQKIKGAIKRIMGYDFERIMANLYADSSLVLRLEPGVNEVAKDGQPDRIVYLSDGSIRICSWKVHNENESIKVADSPEIRLTRHLQATKNVIMVLEGLFQGRFFSIVVDPEQSKGSVRVRKEDMQDWPPDLQKILEKPTDRGAKRLESSPPDELGGTEVDIAVESVEAGEVACGVETGQIEEITDPVTGDVAPAGNVDSAAPPEAGNASDAVVRRTKGHSTRRVRPANQSA